MGGRQGEDNVMHTRARRPMTTLITAGPDVQRLEGQVRSSSCASRSSTTATSRRRGASADGDDGVRRCRWRRSDSLVEDGPVAGHRGRPRSGPSRPERRRPRILRPVVGPTSWDPERGRRRRGPDRGDRAVLARLAGPGAGPDHRWREPIQRSARRSGPQDMPTGRPWRRSQHRCPRPRRGTNWEYRFTWIRDSTFTCRPFHFLILDWEAEEFMQFVADLEPNTDGGLQIMYGIDGRRDLTESTRDERSGYAGAHPVRIGNGAFDQRQNDVFGAALDSILLHARRSRGCRGVCGRSCRPRPRAPPRSGRSRIRGSGRRAGSRSSTSRPS